MSIFSDDQIKEIRKNMPEEFKEAVKKFHKDIEESVANFIREESKKMGNLNRGETKSPQRAVNFAYSMYRHIKATVTTALAYILKGIKFKEK